MKTKLAYQSYGSSILIYINAENDAAAHAKWLSLANWGATSLLNGAEPEIVTTGVICCWSTVEQLQKYLFDIRINELCGSLASKFKGVVGGFAQQAKDLAATDFAEITRETYRSVNSNFETHDMGTIQAERPDDSFVEQCVAHGLQAK